jgi:GNAT superfamily N-acetyltransferase
MKIEACDLEQAREATREEAIRRLFDGARGEQRERYLIARSENVIGGAMLVRPDAFDSEVLSVQIGRVELALQEPTVGPALVSAGKDLAREAGYACLLAQVDAQAWHLIWTFSDQGFHLVDVSIEFEHDLRHLPPARDNGEMIVDDASESDVEAVVDSCATIFRRSRFYTDPFYPDDRADELHRLWIRNCYRGRADRFLVARVDGETIGFLTCMVDRSSGVGRIELAGVKPDRRGKGAATQMFEAALHWFADHAERVLTKTQVTNFAIASVFTRVGFRLHGGDLTFSKVLGEE